MRLLSIALATSLAANASLAADAKVERPTLNLSGSELPAAAAGGRRPALRRRRREPRRRPRDRRHPQPGPHRLRPLRAARPQGLPRRRQRGRAGRGHQVLALAGRGRRGAGQARGLRRRPVTAEFHLFNAITGKEELLKRYSDAAAQVRMLAHRFADDLFTFYTHEPGRLPHAARLRAARSRASSRSSSPTGTATTRRQLTGASLNLLPAWAPRRSAAGLHRLPERHARICGPTTSPPASRSLLVHRSSHADHRRLLQPGRQEARVRHERGRRQQPHLGRRRRRHRPRGADRRLRHQLQPQLLARRQADRLRLQPRRHPAALRRARRRRRAAAHHLPGQLQPDAQLVARAATSSPSPPATSATSSTSSPSTRPAGRSPG